MKNKKSNNRFLKGFTLLELLVSIGIMGFLLGAILKSQAQLIYVADSTSRRVLAQQEVRRLLTEIERDDSSVSSSTPTGVFDADHVLYGMRWEKRQSELMIFTQTMKRFTYRIHWKERNRESSFEGSVFLSK